MTLAPSLPDETVALALDLGRWSLVRLHRIAGGRRREPDFHPVAEAVDAVSQSVDGGIFRLFSWGCVGEDWCYVDEMRDSEGLAAYLGRIGSVPVPVAARWIAALLDEWEVVALPWPGEVLSRRESFEVVCGAGKETRLVLSGVQAVVGAALSPGGGSPEEALARLFESLVRERLDALSHGAAEAIRRSLDGASFREALRVCADLPDGEGEVPPPRSQLLEWMGNEWKSLPADGGERRFPDGRGGAEDRYAVSATVRGAASRLQILPGPLSLPREGWLDQHHRATRRPGRGRAHQWQVNYLEDAGALTLVGEECPAACSLGDWAGTVGPLDQETATVAARRIEEALVSQESVAPPTPVWWLPPENVFLLEGRDGFWTGDAVSEWGREIPMKFRLHQTLATLMAGVGLPPRLREWAAAGTADFAEVRRASVLFPLLWLLSTGSRFHWDRSPAHRLVAPGLAEWFDLRRRQLAESPETFAGSIVEAFAAYCPEPGPEPTTESEVEQEPLSVPESAVESVPPTEIKEQAPPVPEHEDNVSIEPLPPEPVAVRRSSASFWGWTALAGAVASLAVGYGLSGWTFRQGPYPSAEALRFEMPPAQRSESGSFVAGLSEFLLAEGSATSLRFLGHLDRLGEDADADGRLIIWLEDLYDRGSVEAARHRAELAEVLGEHEAGIADWWLVAAKAGNLEAKYRSAVDWSGASRNDEERQEAVTLLEEAASAGHAAARVRLSGIRLEEGRAEEAFDWMRRAAEQGETAAMTALGVHYAEGIGCEPDPVRAAEQFRAAAERGDGRAMFEYGRCLANGFGLPVSYPEALRWMRLSESLGYAPAVRWLAERGFSSLVGGSSAP